jgi:hypothetical protein
LNNKWYNKHKKNTLLSKAFRCSGLDKSDWTITQLHDFSEDWQQLEAKYIREYDSFHNGLNSTISGACENTDRLKAAASINGQRNGAANSRKSRSKPVICCSTILFDSTRDASRQTGVNQRDISRCCLGKRKTAGGFTWNFVFTPEPICA